MKRYTKEEILQKLREVAQKLGPSFKANEFKKLTGIDLGNVSRKYGSWYNAMMAAGLEPIANKRDFTKPELIEHAKILAAELGKNTITIDDWKKKGICSNGVIYLRFGNWSNFLTEAGLKIGNPQNIPNDALLSEMARLHNLLGKRVSPMDMDSKGAFSSSTYIKRWGSWKNVWSCYLDSPYVISAHKQQEIIETHKSDKHYFGDVIDMPGLLHAPVNELGVIYLFALLSKRLGYSIEGIQSPFPDAVEKRKLSGQKRWEV